MTVFVVAQLKIHDRAAYAHYEAGFMDVFRQFGGRLLAVDENPAVEEGAWECTRIVLASFPDEASYRAWWQSPGYRDIVRHRHAGADATILLVKGLA